MLHIRVLAVTQYWLFESLLDLTMPKRDLPSSIDSTLEQMTSPCTMTFTASKPSALFGIWKQENRPIFKGNEKSIYQGAIIFFKVPDNVRINVSSNELGWG